jgi:hypothetical protein
MLRDYSPEVGMETARRIVNEDQRFPSIARFREAAGAIAPRREESRWAGASACPICAGVGLVEDAQGRPFTCNCTSYGVMPVEERPRGTDQTPRLVAAAREVLARRGRLGQHWHGGPDPCPVCGGRRPERAA